jgi:hypothetical protein
VLGAEDLTHRRRRQHGSFRQCLCRQGWLRHGHIQENFCVGSFGVGGGFPFSRFFGD